jgi:hypothetical protein
MKLLRVRKELLSYTVELVPSYKIVVKSNGLLLYRSNQVVTIFSLSATESDIIARILADAVERIHTLRKRVINDATIQEQKQISLQELTKPHTMADFKH